MNWMHFFQRVAKHNVEMVKRYKDCVDWVIVDSGSTDGVQKFLQDNFQAQLDSRLIRFYEIQPPKQHYHLTHGKNMAHKLMQVLVGGIPA